MLISLADAKTMLGISGSSEDSALTFMLRMACGIIRSEAKRYFGGEISTITAASPAVVTSIGHGLATGDVIVIAGSNSGVTIDGTQTITVITRDTFSVAVNNLAGVGGSAGTAGRYARKLTEYYNGTNSRDLWLREKPVQSIASVYLDSDAYWGQGASPFDSTTLLVEGTDYALEVVSSGYSKSGRLVRIGGVWTGTRERSAGLLTAAPAAGQGNIKATYTADYPFVPGDIQGACANLLQVLRQAQAQGLPLVSESLDYYSYQLAGQSEAVSQLGNVKSVIASYKSWNI